MINTVVTYKSREGIMRDIRIKAKDVDEVHKRVSRFGKVVKIALGEGSGTTGGFAVKTEMKKAELQVGQQVWFYARNPDGDGRIIHSGTISSLLGHGGARVRSDLDKKSRPLDRGEILTSKPQKSASGRTPLDGSPGFRNDGFNPEGKDERIKIPWKASGVPDGVFTVAVDLHHTLADGWKKDDPGKPGDPLPGAKEAMKEMIDLKWKVIINSVYQDRDDIKEWLDDNDIPYSFINENPQGNNADDFDGHPSKIDADVYVDDRGLHFNGDWDETLDKIKHRAKEQMKSIWRKHFDPNSPKRKSWASKLGDAIRYNDDLLLQEVCQAALKGGVTDYESLRQWLGEGDGSPEFSDGLQEIQHILEATGRYGYGQSNTQGSQFPKNLVKDLNRWLAQKWAMMDHVHGKQAALHKMAVMLDFARSKGMISEDQFDETVQVLESIRGAHGKLSKAYEDLHAAGPDLILDSEHPEGA